MAEEAGESELGRAGQLIDNARVEKSSEMNALMRNRESWTEKASIAGTAHLYAMYSFLCSSNLFWGQALFD